MAIGNGTSKSIVNSDGVLCSKLEITLNLGCLDGLLPTGSSDHRSAKGKSIASIAIASSVSDLGVDLNMMENVLVAAQESTPVAAALPDIPIAPAVPATTSPAMTSWAGIVKSGPPPFRQALDFIPSVLESNSSILKIPSAVIEAGRKKFSLCLVGQFLGVTPKLGLIHAISNKLWGRHGSITVAPYKPGLLMFQFPTEASLSRALYGGPWHVSGIPLILRPWDSKIQPLDTSTSILPVWIQFRGVPLELSLREGLSYLASAIGKPLHMDQDCSKLLKSDCINVCAEVDFRKPLLPNLVVNLDGEEFTIGVSYSSKPQQCTLCSKWGHH
ncbi:hypothetical protein Tsubulata_003107 [Turnera subulata]|uniref:DUF4283 domain-containing protein n=1 Tax=Turnera subulata TaxID=218843 RepID=A0A9Q0FVW2_9ROSI|nr:hypothetical protein Tsubulata_003107 [Turnera subulata]